MILREQQTVVTLALVAEGGVQFRQGRARHETTVRGLLRSIAEDESRVHGERGGVHERLGGELGLHVRPEGRPLEGLLLQAKLMRDAGDELERLLGVGVATDVDGGEELVEIEAGTPRGVVRLAQARLDDDGSRAGAKDVLRRLVVVRHVRDAEEQGLLHALLEGLEQDAGFLLVDDVHERHRGRASSGGDREGTAGSRRRRATTARHGGRGAGRVEGGDHRGRHRSRTGCVARADAEARAGF